MAKLKCWKEEKPTSGMIGELWVKSWQNKKNQDTVIIHELDEGYGASIQPIDDVAKVIGKVSKNFKSVEKKAYDYMKKHDKC